MMTDMASAAATGDGNPAEHEEVESTGRSTGLAETVHRLGGIVGSTLPAGDVAELRRLDPERPSAPAFWKLVVGELEELGALRRGAPDREEQERRWAVILNAIAHLGDLHRPGRGYGVALASSGFSEHRFGRLLRARSGPLWYQARRSAQFLSSHAEPTDATGLAWLVLSDGRSDEQRARRQLARDYYRAHPTTQGA